MAFNAARQKIYIPDLSEELNEIISNRMLSKFYLNLAEDLEVHEPKQPKEVFKVHLEENYKGGEIKNTSIYSIYVNAFVNAGLTKDTLMISEEDEEDKKKNSFVLQVTEESQIAAVAGLGLICPWNT